CLLVVLALAAILAEFLAPYEPAKQDLNAILQPPSWSHLLGTDYLGRDVISRLIHGARTSLAVGIFAQAIVAAIGISVGTVAGYGGKHLDQALMRFTDVVYAFPDLLFVILLRAIFGGSIFLLFLAIGLVNWCTIARLTRAQVLSLKEREFIVAARAMGASPVRISLRHLLPNAMDPLLVAIAFGIPRAIFIEAALSYIGIGVTPPTPSWGTMIQEGYGLIFVAPHLVAFPALAIALTMLAFTFLGDGLRDAMDPRAPLPGVVG
ncbi:MAG: ABC transporter permease, partial [Chloroflexota bacterium]|nr:ABC transporter permease [Chloroflexota bacterium]